MAGLSMPGSILSTNLAVAIRAPVLPALTQADALPVLTKSIATRIEESFFPLNAKAGDSSISTCCEAW